MRKYETMYVLRADLEAEKTQEIIQRYNDVITNHQGEIEEVKDWGKRRLAYEIEGNREGHYLLVHYSAPTDVSKELERLFRISDEVIRYLTTRVEE